jgi:NADH-quinone oxidoreductase subunit A
MTTPVAIVAYLALFAVAGFAFLFINLLVGRFVRISDPHPEKLEVYECGEPTIGSSFVQFDLRFYVVALLFIIFDVEVAFFFPWANVFGKATHLSDPRLAIVQTADTADSAAAAPAELTTAARGLLLEMGIKNPQIAADATVAENQLRQSARTLAWLSMWDIAVFFAVLMVGFAYVWKRGDLDWVRAITHERSIDVGEPSRAREHEPALTG